jgi:hypothetical protein
MGSFDIIIIQAAVEFVRSVLPHTEFTSQVNK